MKRKTQKALAILLALSICFSTGYADVSAEEKQCPDQSATEEISTSEEDHFRNNISTETVPDQINLQNIWDETAMQAVYEQNNYRIIYSLTGVWENGYTANVKIENISDCVIHNWWLTYLSMNEIERIWNAELYDCAENEYIIKNAGWNQDIPVGGSVEYGFVGKGSFQGFPQRYEILGETTEIHTDDYNITYGILEQWDTGFTAEIIIKNQTDKPIEDWRLSFLYDNEIYEIWNAAICAKSENHYEISGRAYNQNIAPDSSISFSFRVENGNASCPLSQISLNQITNSGISDTGTGDMEADDIELTVITGGFSYNETLNCYFTSDVVQALSGTLNNTERVTDFIYQIRDINHTVIKEGEIDILPNWCINDFGLVVGANFITLTAQTDEKEYSRQLIIINTNEENMNQTSIDRTDDDGDGLMNYYEIIFGTDTQNPDTDGDGISDFDEVARIGTNPVLPDTDYNGRSDGEEDFDQDGLTNLEELRYDTNPFSADSDNDGLTDGEEIHIYGTDPLLPDTDQDGLRDGAEPRLGFEPTKPDTDDNGILDSQELLPQVYQEEIQDKNKPEILSVSVGLTCKGLIDDVVDIHNLYNLDMKTSDVVGLIGVPVDISVNTPSEEAIITFSYDEAALGDTKEENLCVMWYDEENDNYILLENSTVDTERNTVSYTTDHFSTYLVVDKEIWLDTWRQDMNYRTSGNVSYYDIALVVDTSGSMRGSRIDMAKTALNTFINAMMEKDRGCLVEFNTNGSIVQKLTLDKQSLISAANSLSVKIGSTNANAGLLGGMNQLLFNPGSNNRIVVLICDGDVNYAPGTLQMAMDNNITIHCINVADGSSSAMETLAAETNGMYYYAATSEDISLALAELQKDTIDHVDMTDTDGDGLYDVYETNGMRLSNGQIVYTDPTKADSDGDGINDYDAMGGEPVQEEYRLNGNAYSCTLNHAVVYGKLSPDFIYVDGTINPDGKQYYGEMEYVPFSNEYRFRVYEEENTITFEEYDDVTVLGDAGVHGSFYHVLADKDWYDILGYFSMAAITQVLIPAYTPSAKYCFYAYMTGYGGLDQGLIEGSTRMYLNSQFVVTEKLFGLNSGNTYLQDNMYSAAKAAEAVLNEYNTEVYLALSPGTVWSGCSYHDTTTVFDMEQNLDALFNLSAFGIYNAADAAVTLHCIYDPDSGVYYMEYVYYLIDFYDFSFYDILYNLDKLGLARSYELYGTCPGNVSWHKGDDSYSFYQVLAGEMHYEIQKEQ